MSLVPKHANPLVTDLIESPRPSDISWMPSTLAWKVLILLGVGFGLYRLYLLWRKYQRNTYRRCALKELISLGGNEQDLRKIPIILRRTALYAYSRRTVASLSAHGWEAWLDTQVLTSDFSGRYSGMINTLAYAPLTSIDQDKLNNFKNHVAQWIRLHRGDDD